MLMPNVAEIDDTPNELLLSELVSSHAWRQVQARLIERRDQYVASLVGTNPEKVYEIQRKLGFIEALNEIAATPEKLLDKARAAAKETTT